MAVDRLFFDVIEIDDLRRSGWRAQRDSHWNFEAHHQHSERLIGIVGNRMLHARGDVGKIICAHGMLLVPVLHKASSLHHEINLFLALVQRVLTIAVGVERDFAEAAYASQCMVLVRALAKDRFVVAGCRCQIRICLFQVRNLPV